MLFKVGTHIPSIYISSDPFSLPRNLPPALTMSIVFDHPGTLIFHLPILTQIIIYLGFL